MFTLSIPNTHESIDRPTVYSVLADIRNEGLLPKWDRMEYHDAVKQTKTPGSSNDDEDTTAHLPGDKTLTVQVTEEYTNQPTKKLWTSHNHIRPIFKDEVLGIYITPMYEEVSLDIEITYTSRSISQLRSWQRDVRNQAQLGKTILQHQLEHAITLNHKAYLWLESLHTLRENMHGYGEDLSEYIARHSLNELTVISAGTHYQLAISEFHSRALGILQDPHVPSVTEVSEGVYQGSFSYRVTMEKAIATLHKYPILIHQQLIPTEYVPLPADEPHNAITHSPLLRAYTTYGDAQPQCNTIRIPNVDRAPVDNYPHGYFPLITALVQLDENSPLELFNLRELGDAFIHPKVTDVIEQIYYDSVCKPYTSPFHICVHRDNTLLKHEYLSCSSSLDLSFTQEVNQRYVYRVSFCLLTDLTAINYKYLFPIRNDEELKRLITEEINWIVRSGLSQGSGVNRVLIPDDFDLPYYINNVLPLINNQTGEVVQNPTWGEVGENWPDGWKRGTAGGVGGSSAIVSWKTVMTSSIEAHKKR